MGYRFPLSSAKLIVFIVGLILVWGSANAPAQAQRNTLNLQYYDERFLHYGFLLGFHGSRYRLTYHEDYLLKDDFNQLHSIHTPSKFGFQVGFVFNMHIADVLDFRLIPTVGFYENQLEYRYTDHTNKTERLEYTRIELPMLIKYTSFRRRNTRMYLIAGPSLSFRASHRKKEDLLPDEAFFQTKRWAAAFEAGAGFDLFNPYFKLAIELRHQWGLDDALNRDASSDMARAIQALKIRTLSLYLTFEGSP